MFEFESKVMSLLNNHFKDRLNYDQKKEIADFIETHTFEINDIINDMKMGARVKGGVYRTQCQS